MKVLFSILMLSVAILAGSITAVLLLIKRHRMRVSDESLRRELEAIEQEQRIVNRQPD
jgi:sensor c-di-GMP phosphodiesterase-like protein